MADEVKKKVKKPVGNASARRLTNMLMSSIGARSVAALVLLTTPVATPAALVKMWQLKETAAAPGLVVARVVSIEKNERIPDSPRPPASNNETWAMTATVEVLRSFTNSANLLTPKQLQIRYLAYGPSVHQWDSGMPLYPQFERGQVLILPLQANVDPLFPPSRLIADQGMGLTIPALAEMKDPGEQPTTARIFLLREIANSLDNGTPRDVTAISRYLANQNENLTPELMPIVTAAIGENRQRWAELATGVLSAQGTPRPSVADLIAGELELAGPRGTSFLLAQAALQKLKASPETDALLIRTWIANAPVEAWGSAGALLEYGDDPVTTETLRQALKKDLAGTSYIAWTLVRNGHRAVLPEALARSLRVVDRPDADRTDLQGAAATLRDFGSDQQLRQLATLVGKYQTRDPNFYSALWQSATESGNPREARVLAVLLRHCSPISAERRDCDFAVGVLERATGQQFQAGGKTLAERDEAVSRALAWLAANGFPN